VCEIDYPGETRFPFVVHRRDDPARELTPTMLVFDVPGSKGV
jgi:hypothetical protein